MRENLLKKQPTWGLRRAQGTGQKSATPATLTKVILVLLTMFLIPSAAWGGSYNSGTLDTSNKTWGVWKLSDATYSSSQMDYLSFSDAESITLTLTRPDNTSELIQSISLNIGGTLAGSATSLKSAVIRATPTDISLNFAISDESSLTYSFQPTVPIEWSGDIVITLQGTNNSGSILGAYVQTVTGYGLTVAGVPVTDDNNTNILGDPNSTVSFTPAGQDPSATLTLKNNANITGDIVWNPSVKTDLTINLSGTNTLNGAISTNSTVETNLSFTGSTDCSLEITKGSESVISGNFKTVNFGNFNLATSSPGAYWDENENRMADYSGGAATNLKITSEVYYPIWVHDYNSSTGYLQLTPDVPSITYDGRNADHTNDKGTISFDKDHNTITLDAITYAQGTDNAVIVVGPSMSELTVDLVDESSVSDPDPVLYFTGSTNLTFTTSSSGASLSANSLYAWKNNAGSVTYNNGLVENNGTISYQAPPITVAGVSPDSEGKFSGISGVTFTPAKIGADQSSIPATLTLNEATINGKIEWKNGTNNLRLCLSGKNSIICNKGGEPPVSVFKAENTCTLFVEKVSDAESATLKYASYGTTDGTPSNVTSYFENFILSANTAFNQTAFVIQDGDIKYNYLTTTGTDNLSVAGIQVHGISGELGYRNNILQDEDATVKFDGSQTLTLNNAEIYSFSSTHAIETGLSTLNIDLKGNNSITTEGGYALYGATSSGSYTIIFTSSSDPVGNLTLKRSSGTLANYVTIDYDTNTGLVPTIITPSDASDLAAAKEAIIAKGTAMGITVAGVVVTNSNYTDIKGDGITGTKVSFTPANEGNETPAILTLNNASITGNVKFNDDLTVHLVGDNTITKPEDASGFYAFDLTASYNDLNLSTDETNPGTLKFVGLGSDSQAGSQRDYIIYSTYGHKNFTSDTTGDPTWKETYSTDATPSYFILSLNKHYNLWKSNSDYTQQFHDLNLSDNDGFVFDPEESTLTISSSSSSDTYYINSGLEDLTIIVSGSQSLSYIAFGAPEDTQAEGITTGTLTITGKEGSESSSSINSLSLGNNSSGVITGFSSVDLTLPMHVSSPENFTGWTASVTSATITDETYNPSWRFEHGQSYATYCDPSADIYLPSTITPSVITEISGSTVKTQALSYIPKGVPVLLSNTNNTATTATFSKNLLKFAESDNPVTASEGKVLYVLYNDQFVKVTPESEIYYAGYLDLTGVNLPSNTRSLTIDGDDEGTTALREVRSEGVKGEKLADGEWYTLQGQRVTKPTKPGLYILNGKKVVIK